MSTEIFNLENNDYMWLNILYREKNAYSIKRPRLNDWAKKYDIDYTSNMCCISRYHLLYYQV